MNLEEFQNDNGRHLEKVGFFDGKTVQDLLDHLKSEVEEVQEQWDKGAMLYFDGPDRKPEGVVAELADVVLLALDLAHFLGISMEDALAIKDDYNRNRRGKK